IVERGRVDDRFVQDVEDCARVLGVRARDKLHPGACWRLRSARSSSMPKGATKLDSHSRRRQEKEELLILGARRHRGERAVGQKSLEDTCSIVSRRGLTA